MTGEAPIGSVDAAENEGRIPDFFIVGHSKCGTTALYRMLRSHPQIFMPDLKETYWFYPGYRPPWPGVPTSLEEYKALFAPALPGQVAGEATPRYLRSEMSASAIAEANPDARCIAIFREPVSFVRSIHLQHRRQHRETEADLGQAIAAEETVRDGQIVRTYSDVVAYAEQLGRYHTALPPEQTLVLIYEDFRADNAATLRRIQRFLGVDDSVVLAPLEANTGLRVRSSRIDSIVSSVYDGHGPVSARVRRAAQAVVPDRFYVAPQRLRRRLLYADAPPIDDGLAAELRERFRPEVEAFGDYIGRDLVSFWGY